MTPLSSSVDLAKAIAAGHTVVFLILMIDRIFFNKFIYNVVFC